MERMHMAIITCLPLQALLLGPAAPLASPTMMDPLALAPVEPLAWEGTVVHPAVSWDHAECGTRSPLRPHWMDASVSSTRRMKSWLRYCRGQVLALRWLVEVSGGLQDSRNHSSWEALGALNEVGKNTVDEAATYEIKEYRYISINPSSRCYRIPPYSCKSTAPTGCQQACDSAACLRHRPLLFSSGNTLQLRTHYVQHDTNADSHT